jgi:SanA protein
MGPAANLHDRLRRMTPQLMVVGLSAGLLLAAVALVNLWVWRVGSARIVAASDARPAEAVLVPGGRVFPDGRVSTVVADRLATALRLYRDGRAAKILVSGDHGRADYDEVNATRNWLLARGVPAEDVFMDHAGFDTHASLYRAREVFAVRRVIVATQEFHLPRALFLADRLGLDAQGVAADRHVYVGAAWYQIRETGARIKAVVCTELGLRPRFLGPVIPIGGDGRATCDR